MNKTIAKVTHLVQLAAIGTAATSLSLVSTVPPSLAAPAPSCVTTRLDDKGYTDYLWVTNHCRYNVRVKVVLAFATDRACRTIAPGATANYSWGYPGRFDRLESC